MSTCPEVRERGSVTVHAARGSHQRLPKGRHVQSATGESHDSGRAPESEAVANPPSRLTRRGATFHRCLVVGSALWLSTVTHAVVFFATSDVEHNTSAPQYALTNSGWQWQGNWGGFLGTAIGPHHFVSAQHIGGTVGDPFVLNGAVYTTVAATNDPSSDLRLWEVSGTFPSYAPLFRGTDEVGRSLVVFGRGGTRGSDVIVTNGPTTALQGWLWAGGDGRLRWGENVIAGIYPGGAGLGNLLRAAFDASGLPNEAHLAAGDSAGAVFIQDQGEWKLAGINYAVDGRFNYTTNGNGFDAALVDAGGLYNGNSGNWHYITNQPYNIPSSFYATRISDRAAWIDSVTSAASPATDVPLWTLPRTVALSLLLFGIATLALRQRVAVAIDSRTSKM